MEGGMSSISIIGTVRVSSVKFRSIRTRALSASVGVGFPTAAPLAAAAEVSGRGRRLFSAKLAGRTGPTSAKQQEVHPSKLCYPKKKHDIYLKRHKNYICKQKKQYRWRLTHLPSLLTRRHWHSWISGEERGKMGKSPPVLFCCFHM